MFDQFNVVWMNQSPPEEMCNSCLEFIPMDQLRERAKVRNLENVFGDFYNTRRFNYISYQQHVVVNEWGYRGVQTHQRGAPPGFWHPL